MKKAIMFLLMVSVLSVGVFAQTCAIPTTDPTFTCQSGVSALPVSPAANSNFGLTVSGATWKYVFPTVYKWTGPTGNPANTWVTAGTLTGGTSGGGWLSLDATSSAILTTSAPGPTTYAFFACNPEVNSNGVVNPNLFHCNGDVTITPNGITGSGKWMLHKVSVTFDPTAFGGSAPSGDPSVYTGYAGYRGR